MKKINDFTLTNQPTLSSVLAIIYQCSQSVTALSCPVLNGCVNQTPAVEECRRSIVSLRSITATDAGPQEQSRATNWIHYATYLLTSLELPFRILPFLNSATCVNLQSSSVHILKLRVHWSHVGES